MELVSQLYRKLATSKGNSDARDITPWIYTFRTTHRNLNMAAGHTICREKTVKF